MEIDQKEGIRDGSGQTHFEALLEVLVFFQEGSIVDDDLSVGNAKVQNLVVHHLSRLYSANRFFQVNVKRP